MTSEEEKSEISVFYKVLMVVGFVLVLNQFFAWKFKDLKVPFIPRVVENRQNQNIGQNTPIRFEFMEEFLTALQNKRNRIVTGEHKRIFLYVNMMVRIEKWFNFGRSR